MHHHTGEEQLQKLKENFKEAAAGLEFEVFAADIESKQNTSFAEFCNEAARKATGEYLFFLDESVQLASECLNAMLLAAEQNEKAGAVGARILYPESEKAISKFASVKSCGIAFHKKTATKPGTGSRMIFWQARRLWRWIFSRPFRRLSVWM